MGARGYVKERGGTSRKEGVRQGKRGYVKERGGTSKKEGVRQGKRGYVKERLELTLMGSFDVEQRGINSGPDSHGIPEGVRTDGPGFSLCATPLESSSPGFRDRRVDRMNERRYGVYRTGDGRED